MGTGGVPCPKPVSRKAQHARETREARAVVTRVRAADVLRDGHCRLAGTLLWSSCCGRSQWAHLNEHRRCFTVGQPAEERHTTAGTCMLCERHHDEYDRHLLTIEPLTELGADGTLRIRRGDLSVLSVPRFTEATDHAAD